MQLQMTLARQRYAVCRLPPGANVPAWAQRGSWTSITRTPDELSLVVTDDDALPADLRAERGFRRLTVQGPLAFELTGILARISATLADAQVSIFAVSTFDTDHVFVREADLPRATAALRGAGITVEGARR